MDSCTDCVTEHSPTNSGMTNNLMLMALISHLKWTSLCLIFEEGTERDALDLVMMMSRQDIFVVLYPMSDVTSASIDSLGRSKFRKAPDRLNFTLLCNHSQSSCMSFVQQPFRFDRRDVWRNSLLHFSRWVVMVSDSNKVSSFQKTPLVVFDNVAVITFKHSIKNRVNNASSTCPQSAYVSTLLWGVGSKRRLAPVGTISPEGNLTLVSNVFPNVKFGFNGRRFKVSVLTWHPFTFIDDETKQYSGLMIDMLEEMSQVMNFTYDIQEPLDGNWGAIVNKEDNTWNGLVGELQRRDVDIVFAPISINPQRETVMDFSHPFYYEFSAILLKKPNMDESRWTTLIEIFSPYVMIFISTSLIGVSVLLFVFERYSPFYERVEQRNGLHNFSDSFWYMYGALLTQGGEHMAQALSGRTILTSWWIFCIISAAAYSGNFVAFLAVFKEKLPFSNIEELVQQDTYKWGTLGSSIYQTIFETSELPERINLWNKMVDFNKTDHAILSSNITEQVQKVLNSDKYAFIGDKTGMELALLTQCELTTATSDLLPLQYGLGLPNNSPFVQLFSEEIVVILESGLIPMWKKKYLPKPEKCLTENKTRHVTLFDIQLAFYFIVLGIVVATLILFCECLKKRARKCPRSKIILQRKQQTQHDHCHRE